MTTRSKRIRSLTVTKQLGSMPYSVSQQVIMHELARRCPEGTILIYDGSEDHKTPSAVSDLGMIVCSNCGQINGDQRQFCKKCQQELVKVSACE